MLQSLYHDKGLKSETV